MKAIVMNNYGGPEVIELQDIPMPQVGPGQILVKIQRSSLNAGDYFTMMGSPWLVKFTVGFPRPKNHVLGWDFSGTVEALGEGVASFAPGQRVFGAGTGALAQYIVVDQTSVHVLPDSCSFDWGAALPTAGVTAYKILGQRSGIGPGSKLLINGATGGVGTFAVQIGKLMGAEVSAVSGSHSIHMLESLGVDHIIDYTKERYIDRNKRYDCIFDNVCNFSFRQNRRVLSPEGVHIPNTGLRGMGYVIRSMIISSFNKRVGKMLVAEADTESLSYLAQQLEQGNLKVVIDRSYPMEETGQAFSYMITEHAKGKVIIQIPQ